MGTASTKSHSHKKNKRSAQAASRTKTSTPVATPESRVPELSERGWTIASLSILVVAAVLRLYHLSLVPFHHDEGVNGNFLVRLVRDGFYHYDPSNYHGPTLYYFSAVIAWILRLFFGEAAQNTYGLNTSTVRLVPALFGLATVWIVLLLRRQLGTMGSLSAAALLAVSPGAIYLSRYFIHETLFVFFTLGVVVAALKYYEDGHPVYVVLAAASAALLFATKETIIINVPVLVLALASTWLYQWIRNHFFNQSKSSRTTDRGDSLRERIESSVHRLGGPTWLVVMGVVALLVFVGVSVLFYSSFFTNFPKGVYDSLKTFAIWTKTGRQAHVHPPFKYLEWLRLQEGFLLLLAVMGALITLWRPKNSFTLFAAFWAFGTLAAYSLVPYKTPWLVLNFIVPLALVAGSVFQKLSERGTKLSSGAIVVILTLAISVSSYQAIDLNFFNYDNDQKTVDAIVIGDDFKVQYAKAQYYVYVYAHTHREMLALVDEINRIAKITGEGNRLGVTIVSPDYWPLPWYLRDYSRVGYHGRLAASSEPIVIAGEGQVAEVQAMFGDRYRKIDSGFDPAGSYRLRPGVSLLIYEREDVVESAGPRR